MPGNVTLPPSFVQVWRKIIEGLRGKKPSAVTLPPSSFQVWRKLTEELGAKKPSPEEREEQLRLLTSPPRWLKPKQESPVLPIPRQEPSEEKAHEINHRMIREIVRREKWAGFHTAEIERRFRDGSEWAAEVAKNKLDPRLYPPPKRGAINRALGRSPPKKPR